MKRHPPSKNTSKALVLSLAFHVVFLTIWGAIHMQTEEVAHELHIQVEILSGAREPVPKRLQRPLHLSASDLRVPHSDYIAAVPGLHQKPPQIHPVTQTSLLTQDSFSILTESSIPLSTTSDFVGDDTSFSPTSQMSRGTIQMSSGLFSGKHPVKTSRSLGLETQTTLPEITGLTQPDLALVKIARHLLSNRESDVVDIVFIIDASQSMRNDINAVRDHLGQMTDLLEAEKLDFTVGIVAFRDSTGFSLLGWNFQVTPQTTSVERIKKALNDIKCRGGEKASDTLIRAVKEVKFRRHAQRRFILVTDEYVSGSYSVREVLAKMNAAKISVDVIGRNENFQAVLAQGTGGLWLPISSLKE